MYHIVCIPHNLIEVVQREDIDWNTNRCEICGFTNGEVLFAFKVWMNSWWIHDVLIYWFPRHMVVLYVSFEGNEWLYYLPVSKHKMDILGN